MTNKRMEKEKDIQKKGQKEGHTIEWPKRRTYNRMAKKKDIQYVLLFGHSIVCPSLIYGF
jgi:hypothetical protein